jgi:general nucleoside transport system ATP-binding protein
MLSASAVRGWKIVSLAAAPPRLSLRGIGKRYPTVIANDGIDLTVEPGEIHALLGENGAGKSTLMKIVYGVTRPDAGSIEWEGRPVSIANPAMARRLGIAMVFQHFSLFETLTVAENIALALDTRAAPTLLAARISKVSADYGLAIDPRRLVHSMSVGERQRVEIVRCLLQAPRLLIMDEPTSVLTPQAVAKLFATLRRLAAEGISILYISHKLDEVRELCDRATVLRAGKVSGTALPRDESSASLARLMVGHEVPPCHLTPVTPGEVQLELAQLAYDSPDPFGTSLREVGLQVRAGQIVGIAGVSGNGQKELLALISGEVLAGAATCIRIAGTAAGRLRPRERRELGLRFVPEERLGRGAVPELSLAHNALLTGALSQANGRGMVERGLIKMSAARELARTAIERFAVRCGGEAAPANSLSGGNLQKFIVGRETLLQPKVLLVAQPTWGVDVGAAALIHQSLIELRNAGVAVLVLSEDLQELLTICDAIAVLAKGRLSTLEPASAMPLEKIGMWMAGGFIAQVEAVS